MDLQIFARLEECASRKARWNDYAARVSTDVSLTFEWHWALWKARLQSQDAPIAWIEENGELYSVLPFYRYQRSLRGIPLTCVAPLTNLFTNHDALILGEGSIASLRRILRMLEVEGIRGDLFTFPVCEGSALYAESVSGADRKTSRIELIHTHRSPFLTLSGSAEDFLGRQSSNFRYNIRRKTRALERSGTLEFLVLTDLAEVETALRYLSEIERGSWKETAGSSITARPWEMDFYRILTPLAAEQRWLRIYVLLLNGDPVSYDYGLLYRNRYFMLKTSYVEELSKYSPGLVLRWKVLEDLYGQGVHEHDFLGDADAYKLAWTERVRGHAAVLFYNQGFGPWLAHSIGKLKAGAKA